MPTGARPVRWSSRHRSPVPQATSTTTERAGSPSDRTALRRHPTSMPTVMIRFTRSYRGAMASNMVRTARTLSSPFGNGSWVEGWRDTMSMGPYRHREMADERAHIRIGGVPVRVDWSFWLLAVVLGIGAREGWLLVAWVAIVLVSVLVHELGHAFTMRAFHQRPHVMLYAFGGVTYGDAPVRSRS